MLSWMSRLSIRKAVSFCVMSAAVMGMAGCSPGGSVPVAPVATPSAGPSRLFEQDGIKRVSAVIDGHLAVYDGSGWQPGFWTGVNMGVTKPGSWPGELVPLRTDYLRWFGQMKAMHVRVVRVYTLLPPHFYDALAEFNRGRNDPLWLVQGVWTPEEQIIGDDGKGRDLYSPAITDAFTEEIQHVVGAVHGDLSLPVRRGKAGGDYRTDVAPYLLGWLIGTEWYPYAVNVTDQAHNGQAPYSGTYFRARTNASPFESWLAKMLDVTATADMKYGWQRPVAFANWVTTDPLRHPDEPLAQEDLVTVDPNHVEPTAKWVGGYYASYHVYPYYPDFMRYQNDYQSYKAAAGQVDPYAGYLHDLRAAHPTLPVVISEFGVPSSRGLAHRGPLDRDQGMHTEKEQGDIDAALLEGMYAEGFDGGFVFMWQDEWFKRTWNTMELENPDRRPMWLNTLTNEQQFGLMAFDPEPSAKAMIKLDGNLADWEQRPGAVAAPYPGYSLSVTSDAAYLYLAARKSTGDWDLAREPLVLGFDTLPGGSLYGGQAPGVTFAQGLEFLLRLNGAADAHLYINSAYDPFTYQYAHQRKDLPEDPAWSNDAGEIFLPWRLATSRALFLPSSRRSIPFESVTVGDLHYGNSDPADPAYNSLADWIVRANVIELRIPWMLLGFSDPSSREVWNYPYKAGALSFTHVSSIGVQPALISASQPSATALQYAWPTWDLPTYHERLKQSYYVLQQAFAKYDRPK